MTITMYRVTSISDMCNGYPPTYSLEGIRYPWELYDIDKLLVTLPEGYTVAESNGGFLAIYNDQGEYTPVFHRQGGPAIATGKDLIEYKPIQLEYKEVQS